MSRCQFVLPRISFFFEFWMNQTTTGALPVPIMQHKTEEWKPIVFHSHHHKCVHAIRTNQENWSPCRKTVCIDHCDFSRDTSGMNFVWTFVVVSLWLPSTYFCGLPAASCFVTTCHHCGLLQAAPCQCWCRTQKNKATAKHLGDLKAKLCAARRDAWIANICKYHGQRSFAWHAICVADVAQELLSPEKSGGGGKSKGFEAGIAASDGRPKSIWCKQIYGQWFEHYNPCVVLVEVQRFGDSRVALIGFPSVRAQKLCSNMSHMTWDIYHWILCCGYVAIKVIANTWRACILSSLPRPQRRKNQKCQMLKPDEMFEVGKSSLLTALTGVQSEAAAYEFTTLTCIPGWEYGTFNESGGIVFFFFCQLCISFLNSNAMFTEVWSTTMIARYSSWICRELFRVLHKEKAGPFGMQHDMMQYISGVTVVIYMLWYICCYWIPTCCSICFSKVACSCTMW